MKAHTAKHTGVGEVRRAHVVVPQDLLKEVDALVGPRGRSEFFVGAAREKLARERLRKVAHEMVGSLKDRDIPGWETPESAAAWVQSLRTESDERAFSHRPGE
jgi:hypothetical protein